MSDTGSWRELTEWTQRRIREPIEVDVEVHTSSVRIRSTGNISADTGRIGAGQDRGVGDAGWVVLDNGRVAEFASCALSRRESEATGGNEEERGMHCCCFWYIMFSRK